MSVMAILEQPARAKPLATAAPIPAPHQYTRPCEHKMQLDGSPVPPAPVIMATPGSSFANDDILVSTAKYDLPNHSVQQIRQIL
jgi:hypothetical protein